MRIAISPKNEILLGVKRAQWRGGGADPHGDPAFLAARKAAFERDNHRCVFCGWDDPKYQEGHHRDDDHENNVPDNILTVCRWCHRCFHIGLAGVNQLGFLAIHPPGGKPLHPQPLLNQTGRMYDWVARDGIPAPSMATWANCWQESIQMCVYAAEEFLGTSDPAALGDILLNLSDHEYQERAKWMAHLRLVPGCIDELDPSLPEHQHELEVRRHWIAVHDKRMGKPT